MGVDEVGADSFVGMLVPSTEGSTVGNTLGDDDDVDDGDEVVSNTDTERSEVIGNPDLVARLSMSDTKASVTITVASSGRTSRSSCPLATTCLPTIVISSRSSAHEPLHLALSTSKVTPGKLATYASTIVEVITSVATDVHSHKPLKSSSTKIGSATIALVGDVVRNDVGDDVVGILVRGFTGALVEGVGALVGSLVGVVGSLVRRPLYIPR